MELLSGFVDEMKQVFTGRMLFLSSANSVEALEQ